jgi:squalene cyclase
MPHACVRSPQVTKLPADLQQALDRTTQHLIRSADPDGGWQIYPELAPCASALVYAVMKHLGHTRDGDAAKICRWILKQQLPNGGFAPNLGTTEASVTSTAACWAALKAAGMTEEDPHLAKAWSYIDAHGGLEAVAAQALSDPYATGPYLAFVGLLDPKLLPRLPIGWLQLPEAIDAATHIVNAGVMVGILELASVFAYVKGQRISRIEKRKVIDYCTAYQNRDGSINSIALMTLLFLCALKACGEGPGTAQYDLAVAFLEDSRVESEDELYWHIFGSDVWDTAMNIRGLLAAGVPANTPQIVAGITHLCDAQRQTHLARPTPTNGPREGGWGFEFANDKAPDNDDAGVAMSAIAWWMKHATEDASLAPVVERAQDALDLGTAYLEGMQNPDGGWSAYEYGMPGKPRGPLYASADIDWRSPKRALAQLERTVLQLGDPATADITGRLLDGLGRMSYTTEAPTVQRAVAFLRAQQMEDGSWWGRWISNYLAGTAWVIHGLIAVGSEDRDLLDPAIRFLLTHQNEDGGWGEATESYTHPELRGKGPSMPGLTGLVLGALCAAGEAEREAAHKAVAYLIRTQNEDGTWSDDQWQHIFLLPDYFYRLPASDTNQALEGLGRYRMALIGVQEHPGGVTEERLDDVAGGLGDVEIPDVPVRDNQGKWLPAGLRAWRAVGDPSADAIARDIIGRQGQEEVSKAFRELVTNDDPFPPDLDPQLADWLETHANLPEWKDDALIAQAQTFYVKVGWSFALCLFAASLPQAYAAANGARVLLGTQGLTHHTVRRIQETAQFLFDVLDPKAFEPSGRGLAAARKVRLLHATIRQYTLMRAGWSVSAWGIPINQEDYAGTVLTFSIVMVEAMQRMGIPVSEREEEAWVHTWACIGYVMGVDERLLARTPAEARNMMEAIRADQWAASEQGHTLAKQLAASMALYLPMPTWFGEGLAEMLIRELAGDRCADLLGLPKYGPRTRMVRRALRVEARYQRLFKRSLGPYRAAPWARVATWLMQGLINAQREGKQTSFRLPPALVHDWDLDD